MNIKIKRAKVENAEEIVLAKANGFYLFIYEKLIFN